MFFRTFEREGSQQGGKTRRKLLLAVAIIPRLQLWADFGYKFCNILSRSGSPNGCSIVWNRGIAPIVPAHGRWSRMPLSRHGTAERSETLYRLVHSTYTLGGLPFHGAWTDTWWRACESDVTGRAQRSHHQGWAVFPSAVQWECGMGGYSTG
jgi:hypothetical protein